MRTCKRCEVEKDLDQFRPNSQNPRWRLRTCRRCEADVEQQRRDANPEKYRAAWERHRRKKGKLPFQPARVLTQEEKRATWRAGYHMNRENRLRYMSEWAKANPAQQRKRTSARRARAKDAFVEEVDELLVLERYDGACGICGQDVDPTNFHTDHIIPLSRGGQHVRWNLAPAHPQCNREKHARMPWEMIA